MKTFRALTTMVCAASLAGSLAAQQKNLTPPPPPPPAPPSQPEQAAVEVDAVEDALGAHGQEADPGHRRGEADAEGEDQDEPVADAVQRDRGEQDDERGRAGDDPARDPDPE